MSAVGALGQDVPVRPNGVPCEGSQTFLCRVDGRCGLKPCSRRESGFGMRASPPAPKLGPQSTGTARPVPWTGSVTPRGSEAWRQKPAAPWLCL